MFLLLLLFLLSELVWGCYKFCLVRSYIDLSMRLFEQYLRPILLVLYINCGGIVYVLK